MCFPHILTKWFFFHKFLQNVFFICFRLFIQPTMTSTEYLQQYYPMMQQYRNFADISNRLYQGQQVQRQNSYFFSQEDLDFVLFGYSTNGSTAHALSGLKIGEISHGINMF